MERTPHRELVASAVTVVCSKRERPNLHAPKDYVNPIVTDWVIDEVRVAGMEFGAWCELLGIHSDWMQITSEFINCNVYGRKQPHTFTTKKKALEEAVLRIAEVLDLTEPDWEWGQDESHCPEYASIVKSLTEFASKKEK